MQVGTMQKKDESDRITAFYNGFFFAYVKKLDSAK